MFSVYDLSCKKQIVRGAAGLTTPVAGSWNFKHDVTSRVMELDVNWLPID